MKVSLEENARCQGDLEGEQSDVLVGVMGEAQRGDGLLISGLLNGGLEKGFLGQRKTPGVVELGCRMLREGKGERDGIEGVGQSNCRGLYV